MSEKALDLRGSVQVVRRRKRLVGVVMALGLLAGGAYSALRPPLLTSTALIVLPQSTQAAAAAAASSNGGPDAYTETQIVIVRSTPVLVDALPSVRPAMSLDALRTDIHVNSLTGYIISVSAESKLAADAEATANAVVNSYIAYVNSPNSPIPQVSARILQPATSATGKNRWLALVLTALMGALAGVVIGVIAALAISRNDRRLWKRDEIAGSIGVPVLASFPVRHPRDAAGWTDLLEDYEPGARDAWRMRQALQQLGIADMSVNNGILDNGGDGGGSSLAVLSLCSDPGAIALGPQLAVLAASLGIPTALIVGPQEEPAAAATLRTACAMPPPQSSKRPRNLQVIAGDGANFDGRSHAALTVFVAVVDDRTPQMPHTMRARTTILGVSAGAATAEQIARVAVNAVADGRGVAGILVADPEPADHTSGLVPQLARPTRHRLPTRLSGRTTEIRR
ncbi:MAG: Wzz/FepE/Etk N-terminal domain-containing protein [Streptosporangiaceae bacterium]